ncbi:MAG: dTDP-glucose 4,6-dehydratase [Deltaproteobacteria bacterium CG11_big_fil_rev_8_21_14_0_20_47_16]|nr:MAG: dTDP-glucose 4,6-dehydratase [Deltaproteobacteria bacterium CG11_big_fil_rev_8_21_14_0_20_47_16]
MKLLVTGGAGFIGGHFVRLLLKERPDWTIINLDKLTYAGNMATIKDITSPHHHFVKGDICDTALVSNLIEDHHIDAIVNFAAESHVDRSIESSLPFLTTNVLGTESLLSAARRHKIKRYVQVSTDEVYGSAGESEHFTESSIIQPNNPYSASKAAADHLVRAYHVTYDLPACITRCTNNYGSYQFPEKFIPVIICNAMQGKHIPVYGDGMQQREWIHVMDHCRGVLAVLEHGRAGQVYNFSDDTDITNIDLVRLILEQLGQPNDLIQHVKDRLGHDRRYSVDSSKSQRELNWAPKIPFATGLSETIKWYQDNQNWIETVLSHS